MAKMTSENLTYHDGLIAGARVGLMTKNVTVTAGTALKRGAVIDKDGNLVTATTKAYAVVALGKASDETVVTVYVTGEFDPAKMYVAEGTTVVAHEDELRNVGIYLKSAIY